MVNDVARAKLLLDILHGDTHLYHEDHYVIREVGNFVDRFLLIVCLTRNDNLG